MSKFFAFASVLLSLTVFSTAADTPPQPGVSAPPTQLTQQPSPPSPAQAPEQQIVVDLEVRDGSEVQNSKAEDGVTVEKSVEDQAQAGRRQRLTREALAYRGTPYIWGGVGRMGFDCSGFTRYLFAERGVTLPHSAKLQFRMGKPVKKSDLVEGDLVFFNTDRGPLTHVGMYIGDGNFVHAANPRRGVTVTALNSPYYLHRYAGARRYTA